MTKIMIFHDFHQTSPNHKNVTRSRRDIPGTVLESSRCVFYGSQIFGTKSLLFDPFQEPERYDAFIHNRKGIIPFWFLKRVKK